jgi:peptide subunit release factor 1 (eRF1)
MLTQAQFEELLSYDAGDQKVISLYLDADTSQQSIDAIKLQVKTMVKEARLNHHGEAAQPFERYLDHSFDWSKPGLAVFSAENGEFFRAFPVNVSFRNRLRVGHKPYVKPLAHVMDYYAHFGVILVDKVGARFFDYHLGDLQETEGVMGEDIRKLKQGGSSAVDMRGGQGSNRHEDEAVQRNLRDAAAAANAFFSKRPIRRLFLGGTNETVAQFREMLPKQMQSCLAGTFNIDMEAGEVEVRKRSLAMLTEANNEREKRLVKQLITTEAKAGAATIGLDDTLQAVSEKRVQTLIISDGYHTPGYFHPDSGFVVANLVRSPMSESELIDVADVIDTAVVQTMSNGGQVEIINDNPELEGIGRIGAILRY